MASNCCIRVIVNDFTENNIIVDEIQIGYAEVSYNPAENNFRKIKKNSESNRNEPDCK